MKAARLLEAIPWQRHHIEGDSSRDTVARSRPAQHFHQNNQGAYAAPLAWSELFADYIHPSAAGYTLMAQTWFDAVTKRP